jgi:hypothetical protein
MPRKRSDAVQADPVAAAKQLGQQEPDPCPGVAEAAELAVAASLIGSPADQCALGHGNPSGTRFCSTCGLAMDAPAPVKADLDAARPKPAGQLSAEERAERDRQHAEALAAARAFESAPVTYQASEGETVLIHFLEDGLTAFGQVWYRGQELEIGPSHPRWEDARRWILLDRWGQIERYGKQYFERGPWPGRRSYLDGAGAFEQLKTEDGKGRFAGPGEEALRAADEAERRRGRAVPAQPRL